MMESQGALMFIVIPTLVPRLIFLRQKKTKKKQQRSMHTSNQLHVTGPFSYKIKEVG